MQAYHPDRNDDPEAQARAREITAAFAVLRDRDKRAAYDASQGFVGEWVSIQAPLEGGRRPLPPMRNFGIASVTLALAVSLAFAVRPGSEPPSRPPNHRTSAALPKKPLKVEVKPPAVPKTVPVPIVEATPVAVIAEPDPVPAAAPTHEAISKSSKVAQQAPRREMAKTELPKTPAPIPGPRKTAATSPAVQASCDIRCAHDRQAQIERMATSFLNQSIEHADWSKQQLLLSARNRSATSRTLCHSNECVTAAYLRQMRDTTDIMEGRIPGQ